MSEDEKVNSYKQMIGQRIKTRRKAIGWTQEDLAKKLDISRMAMFHIETGRNAIAVDRLPTLMAHLKIDANYLFMNKEFDLVNVHNDAFERGIQEGLKRAEIAVQSQMKKD